MKELDELEKVIKQLKNLNAKKWRAQNKDKVKAINKRYWEKRAKEYLSKNKGDKIC